MIFKLNCMYYYHGLFFIIQAREEGVIAPCAPLPPAPSSLTTHLSHLRCFGFVSCIASVATLTPIPVVLVRYYSS